MNEYTVEIGSTSILLSEIVGFARLTTMPGTRNQSESLYLLLKSGDKHIVDPVIEQEVLDWWEEIHQCVKTIGSV